MTNYPRCRTCRWWETREVERRTLIPRFVKPCLRMSGVAHLNAKTDSALPNTPDRFWTGPDFGCVHHEPRQPESTDV